MRLLIQRVQSARVDVEGTCVGRIERGALAFFAVHQKDTPSQVTLLANKLIHLRIFPDPDDKMNLSLLDIKGSILVVSQFTLYADCSQGRRPSFINSAPPHLARSFYDSFLLEVKKSGLNVEAGIFGAHMQVHLINDGPATFLIDV